ncbi:MAG: DUF2752 domain-containing protein [Phycisphaerae bacterium]|nr:DUF2752 domain-containing protein [Phycisphaerae bacterium]
MKFRLRGLIVALVCFGAIVAARGLDPRRDGHGTHTQMGLSGCGFLARTGYPCPACGITTSLAAMAHGQVWQAIRAHLFGVMLFLAVAAFALLGLAEVLTGGDVLGMLRPRVWWIWIALAGWLLGWGVKVGVGLLTGQYPLWP